MRGLYFTAIEHYEEAQRMLRHSKNSGELAHISHGL